MQQIDQGRPGTAATVKVHEPCCKCTNHAPKGAVIQNRCDQPILLGSLGRISGNLCGDNMPAQHSGPENRKIVDANADTSPGR